MSLKVTRLHWSMSPQKADNTPRFVELQRQYIHRRKIPNTHMPIDVYIGDNVDKILHSSTALPFSVR